MLEPHSTRKIRFAELSSEHNLRTCSKIIPWSGPKWCPQVGRSNWAEIGQLWADIVQTSTMLLNIGSMLAELGLPPLILVDTDQLKSPRNCPHMSFHTKLKGLSEGQRGVEKVLSNGRGPRRRLNLPSKELSCNSYCSSADTKSDASA